MPRYVAKMASYYDPKIFFISFVSFPIFTIRCYSLDYRGIKMKRNTKYKHE